MKKLFECGMFALCASLAVIGAANGDVTVTAIDAFAAGIWFTNLIERW